MEKNNFFNIKKIVPTNIKLDVGGGKVLIAQLFEEEEKNCGFPHSFSNFVNFTKDKDIKSFD